MNSALTVTEILSGRDGPWLKPSLLSPQDERFFYSHPASDLPDYVLPVTCESCGTVSQMHVFDGRCPLCA